MFQVASISNTVEDVLGKKVSFQKNTWSSFSKEVTINEVLKEIQSDLYKTQVQKLRFLLQNGKIEDYNSHKKTLPAVTFCGSFDGERKKSKIRNYNSLIVVDVDKLDSEELVRIKDCFDKDPFVFSYWESPSKEGIKGLVSVRYQFALNIDNLDRAHKSAFLNLSMYFKEKYDIELDNSGSDTTRLCFLSYDPFIVVKDAIVNFELSNLTQVTVNRAEEKEYKVMFSSNKDALYNPENRNLPRERYIIAAIIRFLARKKESITNSYEEWYKVAMAIANSFTYDIGENYFLKLSRLDINKFNEVECKSFLRSCYESRIGAIKFNTIVYYANVKGYITKKQREKGSEAVDGNLS